MTTDIEDRVRESLLHQSAAVPLPTFDANTIRGRANHTTARGPRVLAVAAAVIVALGGLAIARSGRHKPSISTTASSSSSTTAETTSSQPSSQPSTQPSATTVAPVRAATTAMEVPRFVPNLPASYRLTSGMDYGLGVIGESHSTAYATDKAGRYVIVSAIRGTDPSWQQVGGSLTRVRGNLAQFSYNFVGVGSSAPLLAWHEAGVYWMVREFAPNPYRDSATPVTRSGLDLADPDVALNGDDELDPLTRLYELADRLRPDPTNSIRPFTFDAPSSWRVLFDGIDPAHVDMERSLAFTGDDLSAMNDPQAMLIVWATGLAESAMHRDRASAATTTRGHPTEILDGSIRRWVERPGVVVAVSSSVLDAEAVANGLREADAAAYDELTKGRIGRVNPPDPSDPTWNFSPYGTDTATFIGRADESEWVVQWKPDGPNSCIRTSVPFDQASASCLTKPDSTVFLFPPNLSHNATSIGVVRGDIVKIAIIDPLNGRILATTETAAADRSLNARAYATKVDTLNLLAGTAPLVIVAYDGTGREVERMDLFASENYRPNLQPPTVYADDSRGANDPHDVIASGEIEGQRWELRQTRSGDRCAWLVFPVAHVGQYDSSAYVCFSQHFGPIAPGLPSYIVHDLRRRFVVTTVDEAVSTVRASFEDGTTRGFEVVRFVPADGVRRHGSIVWVPRATALTKLEALDSSGNVIGSVTGRVPGARADTWYLGPIGIKPT
jgi:hypothetical protein